MPSRTVIVTSRSVWVDWRADYCCARRGVNVFRVVRRRGGRCSGRLVVLFKLKGGVLTEVLDVSPGRHRFQVEVTWTTSAGPRT